MISDKTIEDFVASPRNNVDVGASRVEIAIAHRQVKALEAIVALLEKMAQPPTMPEPVPAKASK